MPQWPRTSCSLASAWWPFLVCKNGADVPSGWTPANIVFDDQCLGTYSKRLPQRSWQCEGTPQGGTAVEERGCHACDVPSHFHGSHKIHDTDIRRQRYNIRDEGVKRERSNERGQGANLKRLFPCCRAPYPTVWVVKRRASWVEVVHPCATANGAADLCAMMGLRFQS